MSEVFLFTCHCIGRTLLVQRFGLTVVDAMAQPIDVLSDDRGLRACMDGANVGGRMEGGPD